MKNKEKNIKLIEAIQAINKMTVVLLRNQRPEESKAWRTIKSQGLYQFRKKKKKKKTIKKIRL